MSDVCIPRICVINDPCSLEIWKVCVCVRVCVCVCVRVCKYLVSSALHDVLRYGVDLVVHLYAAPLPTADPHQEHTEVGSTQIQGQEVPSL